MCTDSKQYTSMPEGRLENMIDERKASNEGQAGDRGRPAGGLAKAIRS